MVKAGDFIDVYDDEGRVIEVEGQWVHFVSEVTGDIRTRLACSVTVCPSPERIAELRAELKASLHGQPQEIRGNQSRPCNVIAGRVGRHRNKYLMD